MDNFILLVTCALNVKQNLCANSIAAIRADNSRTILMSELIINRLKLSLVLIAK